MIQKDRLMDTSQYTSKDYIRFWSKVNIALDSDSCWNWKASINRHGYGQFTQKSKVVKAHRVAWILTYGKIPDGLHVLHTCDNRACCNPKHLFLGTNKDNVDDREQKGRNKIMRGESNGNSKLTISQVEYIRARYAAGGISQQKLAEETGIDQTQVSNIIRRKVWK